MSSAAGRLADEQTGTGIGRGRIPARGPAVAQFGKFGAVGLSGYAVNLTVFSALVHGGHVQFLAAAVGAFLAAVANNYAWNHLWTFRTRGRVGGQVARFLLVSLGGLGGNLGILSALVALGFGEVVAQATAIGLVAPITFLAHRRWTFAETAALPAEAATVLASGAGRLRAAIESQSFLLPIAAIYVFALVRFGPYELVQDSWLTLVSGREVAERGLPWTDTLTVFGAGARWIDQQWLAQLAYYELFRFGGIQAVAILHVFALGGAFVLALVAARRLGGSQWSVFWVAAASILVAPWAWQLRAQSLAYVLFVATLWLLARDSREPQRRVFVVLPLLALWANLHGSVVVGVGLVVLRGLLDVAGPLTRRRRPRLRGVLLVALPPLLLLASPYGFSLVGYYRHMLVAPEFARIVGEWRAPTFGQAWPFFLLALATVWLLARSGPRLTPYERLALLAFVLMGFVAIRNITWFAFALVVLAPAALDATRRARPSPARAGLPLRLLAYVSAAAIPVALLALAVRPASTYEARWPEEALAPVARVTQADPTVRVFASDRYANWLLWKQPHLAGRVAFDVRFELHSEAELRSLFEFHNRIGADWRRAAAGYELVVLDREADGDLERPLLAGPGARVLYADPLISVLYRPSA